MAGENYLIADAASTELIEEITDEITLEPLDHSDDIETANNQRPRYVLVLEENQIISVMAAPIRSESAAPIPTSQLDESQIETRKLDSAILERFNRVTIVPQSTVTSSLVVKLNPEEASDREAGSFEFRFREQERSDQ